MLYYHWLAKRGPSVKVGSVRWTVLEGIDSPLLGSLFINTTPKYKTKAKSMSIIIQQPRQERRTVTKFQIQFPEPRTSCELRLDRSIDGDSSKTCLISNGPNAGQHSLHTTKEASLTCTWSHYDSNMIPTKRSHNCEIWVSMRSIYTFKCLFALQSSFHTAVMPFAEVKSEDGGFSWRFVTVLEATC
jgi:hypothetical protein